MSRPILEVTGLRKVFPVRKGVFGRASGSVKAVDGIDFHINEGETLALVGETGCGKSTTGRCVLRLIEPTAGRVVFEGVDLATLDAAGLRRMRRRMQIIFQDPLSSLNPRMTVRTLLAEPLVIHGLAGGSRIDERVSALLGKVGLEPWAMNRYPHEFSGGQRQRICLARALAVEPKLLVLDEPVSALDVSVQAQVINLLGGLQTEFGLSYLFIAHDLAIVRHVADRVAVMYLGKIVEEAPVAELFGSARHPYTQALLAAVPTGDPARPAERAALKGELPSPVAPPPGCRFHTRCPVAEEDCSTTEPPLEPWGGGARVACLVANRRPS